MHNFTRNSSIQDIRFCLSSKALWRGRNKVSRKILKKWKKKHRLKRDTRSTSEYTKFGWGWTIPRNPRQAKKNWLEERKLLKHKLGRNAGNARTVETGNQVFKQDGYPNTEQWLSQNLYKISRSEVRICKSSGLREIIKKSSANLKHRILTSPEKTLILNLYSGNILINKFKKIKIGEIPEPSNGWRVWLLLSYDSNLIFFSDDSIWQIVEF